jgi:hypothetical protein
MRKLTEMPGKRQKNGGNKSMENPWNIYGNDRKSN